MVLDHDLATSVRAALAGSGDIREVSMFGGIGFMPNGNLLVGASKRGLLVRVGKEKQAEALAKEGARLMQMRGRTMEGYVYVDPPVLNERSLRAWLRLAVSFVKTLPPKTAGSKLARKKGKSK